MKIYIVVVLQNVPFPVRVDGFRSREVAYLLADMMRKQYEGNRVYVYEREVR